MGKTDVKLVGVWPSPFVLRVRIALNLNNVDYEFLEEKHGSKSELLLKSNPVHEKIPVLIHENKPVCESIFILQYIDEFWSSGPSILPSNPYDHSVEHFWSAYIDAKLVGAWGSACAARIQYALNLKSIDYEFIEESFNPKSDLLLKSNPIHKKIPVFFHANKTICESLVILQYIDQVWSNTSPSILPSDPHDRAIARFWAAYIDDKVFPALNVSVKVREYEKKKEAVEEIREALDLLEDAFVKCSKGKGFFGGECIGYVDIALGSLVGWLRVSEKVNELKMIDEGMTPNLFKWAVRFCSNDSVKDVMPQHDRLLEFAVNVFIPKFTGIACS